MAQRTSQVEKIEQLNQKLRENQQILDRLAHSAAEADNRIDRLGQSLGNLRRNTSNRAINLRMNGSGGSSRSGSNNRAIGNNARSFNQMVSLFGSNRISNTASRLTNTIGMLNASSLTVTGSLGLMIAAIGSISAITVRSTNNTLKYAQALAVMNKSLDSVAKNGYKAADELAKFKNNWSVMMNNIGEKFQGVLGNIVGVLNNASGLSGGEPYWVASSTIADITGSAKASGFSQNSANAFGNSIYGLASGSASRFGITSDQISNFAKELQSAWETGSDAAAKYGVVVNDQVLTGYLWQTKGIDIANVEITDAMKQFYRYELMSQELAGEVGQDMIKDWTKFGFIIDKTKGKLLGFDEVIQLTAADATIPEFANQFGEVLTGDKNEAPDGGPTGIHIDFGGADTNMQDAADTMADAAVQMQEAADTMADAGEQMQEGMEQAGAETEAGLLGAGEQTQAGLAQAGAQVQAGLVQAGAQVQTGFGSLVARLLGLMNSTAASNINNENAAGTQNVNNVNATGNMWLSRISSTANSILNIMGLGGHANVVGGAISGAKSGGLVGAAKGAVNGAKTNVTGMITSPFDVITEGADLISSLRDDKTGKYQWSKLPGAAGKMIVGSIANPLQAVSSGARIGYQEAGLIGGIAGGIINGGIYAGAETIGDLINLGEIIGDLDMKVSGGKGYNFSPSDVAQWHTWSNSYDQFLGQVLTGYGLADGGIGTREIHNATLFEGNKKEAIIPLETEAGINYLSDAIEKAGGQGGGLGEVHVHLTLSGINIADDDAQWEMVGKKIGEVIEVQKQRRGDLNYGSSF